MSQPLRFLHHPDFAAALFLWGCAFAAFAAEPAARASTARTEITTVVQNFVSAWNQNNTETLTDLFTPNGTFTSPRGAKAKGRAAIRNLLTQEHRDIYRGTTLVANVDSTAFPKTGNALAKGTYTLQGVNVMFGIEVSPEGTFTFELTRRSDAWRIASARIFKN